jgi:DNA-binding beta-propeller fold protein YncE
MKEAVVAITLLVLSVSVLAQRPSDPALMLPQNAPALDYLAVSNGLTLPREVMLGPSASVATDAKGHLFVFNRGTQPLAEFDANGKFVRAFGQGLFIRPHGLRIDADGNFWATDVAAHTVMKLNPQGEVVLTIGTKGQAGQINEPNDVAISPGGDIFIAQGHGGPNPGIAKFDKNGNFITSWGGKGTEPGKFQVAHSAAFDPRGRLWVADRENQRIQIFNPDGGFVSELKYAGLPCGIHIGRDSIYMVNGFAGQLLRLDLDGNVLGAAGRAGAGLGEFGEAHYVAVGPGEDIYVADPVNGPVQKFVRKPVPVEQEPRHRVVFQNEALRVLNVNIPAGDTSLDHTHSYDIATVCISCANTRSRVLGAEWGATRTRQTGEPNFTEYLGRPETHRVQNLGTSPYHLVAVENRNSGTSAAALAVTAPATKLLNETRSFRVYEVRLTGNTAETEHRHAAPTVAVLVNGSITAGEGAAPAVLNRSGQWLFIPAGSSHRLERQGSENAHIAEIELR